MDFRVLGPLRVASEGVERRLGAAKQRMLLGVLLVNADRVVSADRLMEAMWTNGQPDSGLKTLRYHLSKLRRWLEPDRSNGSQGVIITEADGYLLRVAPEQIDAGRFERLAAEGSRLLTEDELRLARATLAEALDLWRGDAFDDFRYDEFAQADIARLAALRLSCREDRIAADLDLGDHRDVLGELCHLTTAFPFRERLWGQLMVALYRDGQQGQALRAYQDASEVLGGEFGLEPTLLLRDLRNRIALSELPLEPRPR